MPSCSKGSRGLSVLPRGIRIFTDNAISPGPWSRQRPSRCAVRAGRNLPDKEFRYLRTVIVTAAVYRGLSGSLLQRLTDPRDLPAPGRRQTLYFASRLGRVLCFCKQSLWAFSLRVLPALPGEPVHAGGRPFLLTDDYAEFLTMAALIASECSSYPPVSVLVRAAWARCSGIFLEA